MKGAIQHKCYCNLNLFPPALEFSPFPVAGSVSRLLMMRGNGRQSGIQSHTASFLVLMSLCACKFWNTIPTTNERTIGLSAPRETHIWEILSKLKIITPMISQSLQSTVSLLERFKLLKLSDDDWYLFKWLYLITHAADCFSQQHIGDSVQVSLGSFFGCLRFNSRARKLNRRRTRLGKVARLRQVVPCRRTVSLGLEPPVCPPGEP